MFDAEATISMRHTSLSLLRGCFDDAYRSYVKDTDFSMADDDDKGGAIRCFSTVFRPFLN